MSIIQVNNLQKKYKINIKKEGVTGAFLNLFNPKFETKVAVNNINFSISEGEIVGYVGPNGAGKSTTIKMLTGILTPTSGDVFVNGLIPQKNRTKNNLQIGAVFGQRTQLWWDIPVIESYKLLQKIYEIPKEVYDSNLEEFSEILDLKNLLHMPVRQLSLGQKMRCEVAAAFLHNPKIVYLDEPTIGLDIVAKDNLRNFIKKINKQRNMTVILTTHDLHDIEEICQRIVIIDKGSIIYDHSKEKIKEQFGSYRTAKFKVKNINSEINEVLNQYRNIISLTFMDDYTINVQYDKNDIIAPQIINLISPYCDILDINIQEPSIEWIVKNIYEGRK